MYVARHAEVIPHTISVTCRAGIPGREQLESLRQRQRVGVVEIPGGPYKDGSVVLAVVGKDLFCGSQSPRSSPFNSLVSEPAP